MSTSLRFVTEMSRTVRVSVTGWWLVMLCDATDEPSHWAVALWVSSSSERRCSVDSSETIIDIQSTVCVEMGKGFSECPSLEKIKNNKILETIYLKHQNC